nr:hypothetical protein [Tanacetum cinerariifolium]
MDKTTSRPKGPLGDKDSRGNKPPTNMEPIHPTLYDPSYIDVRALLLSDDEAKENKPLSSTAPCTESSSSDSSSDDFLKTHDNILLFTKHQLSTMKDLQAYALKQEAEFGAWTKSSTNMARNLGSRLLGLERAQNHIRSNMGENETKTFTKDLPSHIEGETDANKQEKSEEPKHSIDANIEFIGIATDKHTKDQRKLVKASSIVCPDPDALVLILYMINGKFFHLTTEQIEAHLNKEAQIKKAKEEARLLAINKPKVIKVVREEEKKLGIHPKEAITAKAGEKFKKAQDVKHEVLKKKHVEKVKKSLELKKHKYDNYMWTISSRLKPKKITNIKIHPKTKPVVMTIYRGIDGKNFDVHNPFAFDEFGISELDKLREIIPRKKNIVVKYLMNSLSQRYERIKKIPKELRIPLALPAPIPEQASSKSLRRKRKHMELEQEINIHGLNYNRTLFENILFLNKMVIEEPEYRIFFTNEFSDQSF